MKIDLSTHRELQEQGLISIQKHPEFPLLIHNYTQRCQWDRAWNDITLQCRGLITDLSGKVICRPFRKFFNLGEHTSPESILPPINWKQSYRVTEKIDGSLGIAYPTPSGEYRMATRGSFVSEQAIRGTEMLRKLNHYFSPNATYLFEIIYPENRIVVDYGGVEELILLDIIDNFTGLSLNREMLEDIAGLMSCRAVRRHSLSVEELMRYSSNEPNREGVVVLFVDGTRIKIKLEEYCRLHKLITGVNARHIWEYLRDGKSLEELIDRVPDEFMSWVNRTATDLLCEAARIEESANGIFAEIKQGLGNAPRKEYALAFEPHLTLRPILFLLLDGRPIHQAIWKQLRPEGVTTFAVADE